MVCRETALRITAYAHSGHDPAPAECDLHLLLHALELFAQAVKVGPSLYIIVLGNFPLPVHAVHMLTQTSTTPDSTRSIVSNLARFSRSLSAISCRSLCSYVAIFSRPLNAVSCNFSFSPCLGWTMVWRWWRTEEEHRQRMRGSRALSAHPLPVA